jgi:tetratricopeptide (TPR) repeat protein
MPEDMPGRPASHALETWSDSRFRAALPPEWVVHNLAADYGIDLKVEIFENGMATGLEFGVQLKATTQESGAAPGVAIRRSTLNYWDSLTNPTLLVIAHQPTDQLWFQWSHLIPYDENPNTKSRLIRGSAIIASETPAEFAEEVRGHRASHDLMGHLPIEIKVLGTDFYELSANPIKTSLRQLLAQEADLVRLSYSTPTVPYVKVAFEGDQVTVGLRGRSMRTLTWDHTPPPPREAIAADICAAIGFAIRSCGAHELGARLIRLAIPASGMLPNALALPQVFRDLILLRDSPSVTQLFRQTACIETHRAAPAILAVLSSGNYANADMLRRNAAEALLAATRNWDRPALGIYNAAGLLAAHDTTRALTLYNQAADTDNTYRSKGYWWREKGQCYWLLEDRVQAEEHYARAIALGDMRAMALHADALMRKGEYEAARLAFEAAPIWDTASNAQWRLSQRAMHYVSSQLGITHQNRTSFHIAPYDAGSPPGINQRAQDALQIDALNGYAHSIMAAHMPRGAEKTAASITAAVTLNTEPGMWLIALNCALIDPTLEEDAAMALGHDAMLCAWSYFGEQFKDFILDDEDIHDDIKEHILALFDAVRPIAEEVELRMHDADTYKSVFIRP